MLRRTAVLLSAVTFSLVSCKARNADSSAVKADGDTAASTGSVNFDALFERFDQDAKVLELALLAGGDDKASSASGIALTDYDPKYEALELARRLMNTSKESALANRAQIENMALELEAMSQLLSANELGADAGKLKEAITRVRAILDAPPADVKIEQPYVAPVATKPAPEVVINYDSLTCASLGDGSLLPQIIQTSKIIGFRGNGGSGFNQAMNCWNSVQNVRNGMVCSITTKGDVAPFLTRTGQQLGPTIAFAQTTNCIKAIQQSNKQFVCIVDNSDASGHMYARFDYSNKAIDWWFATLEQCVAGDKSPDPVRLCFDRCEERLKSCRERAEKYYTGLDQTNQRLECLLKNMKERDACG